MAEEKDDAVLPEGEEAVVEETDEKIESQVAEAPDDETPDGPPAEAVDEGGDEPSPETSEPEDVVEFDEVLVAHAEELGLKPEYFASPEAMRKALNASVSRDIKKAAGQTGDKPDKTETQPKDAPKIPAVQEFEIEFGEDFDPEVKKVIEKMKDHYDGQLTHRDQAIQQIVNHVVATNHERGQQVYDSWLKSNGYSLSRDEWRKGFEAANALADVYARTNRQVPVEEIIRRSFYSEFSDKVDGPKNERKQQKRDKRKRQTATPPNTRGRTNGDKPVTSYRDLPKGKERMEKWIDEFMETKGVAGAERGF